MNKIGVRGHDFGKMSVEELPIFLKNLGFNALQFAPFRALKELETFEDIDEKILIKAKEEFLKSEMEISIYGCYVEIGLLDKAARLEQVEMFKKGITHSKILGAKVIGTETSNLPYDSDMREIAYQGLKDSVLRIAEEAEKQNVDFAIEPVSFHTLNTPELTKRLINEVKSAKMKIILDSVNLFKVDTIDNQHEIIKNCFELFGDRISSLHIKDVTQIGNRNKSELKIENDVFCWEHIGRGIVDYKHILSYVKGKDIALLREGATLESYKDDISYLESLVK